MVGSIFREFLCRPVYWNCWTKPILVEIERKRSFYIAQYISILLLVKQDKSNETERNGFPLEENFIKHVERIGNDTKSAFLALQRLPIYAKFLS